jgi:hypothetical protein
VALGVPGRLRPRIISTFSTTRVVGRQPYAPAALTPGEIPGTHFQRLSRPQGTWFCRKEPRKKSPMTPQEIYPATVRPVAQRFNHYATPGPRWFLLHTYIIEHGSKDVNNEYPFASIITDLLHSSEPGVSKIYLAQSQGRYCGLIRTPHRWGSQLAVHLTALTIVLS